MDGLKSQSFPADSKQIKLAAKRSAFEEINPVGNNKKVKGFCIGLTQADIKLPAAVRRVPFPDKVREDPPTRVKMNMPEWF